LINVINNKDLKSKICKNILRDLAEWFGIESSTKAYIEGVRDKLFIAYKEKGEYVGFVSLEETSEISCDMYVLGVLKKYHKTGIGTKLINFIEGEAKKLGKTYITVKVLSDSHPCENYQKTRRFYNKNGYRMLEELKDLWGEDNPCAYCIKELHPSRIIDITENLRLRNNKSDFSEKKGMEHKEQIWVVSKVL